MGWVGAFVGGFASAFGIGTAGSGIAATAGAITGSLTISAGLGAISASLASSRAKKEARQLAAELEKKTRVRARASNDLESAFSVTTTRRENITTPVAPHEIGFGRVRKGGVRVYVNGTGTNNQFLHVIVAFLANQCERIEGTSFGNEAIEVGPAGNVGGTYLGFAKIFYATGEDDQASIDFIVTQNSNWTTDHRLRGITYGYYRLTDSADRFPRFIPRFIATILGENRIYDPRDLSTGWSENPALICAFILEEYLNVPQSRIHQATLIASANTCDEMVATKRGAAFTWDAVGDRVESTAHDVTEGDGLYIDFDNTTLYRAIDVEVDDFQVSLDANAVPAPALDAADTVFPSPVAGRMINVTAHGLKVGDRVKFTADAGGAPPNVDPVTEGYANRAPNGYLEDGVYLVRVVDDADNFRITNIEQNKSYWFNGGGSGTHTFQAIDRWTGTAEDLGAGGDYRIAKKRYTGNGFTSLIGDLGKLFDPVVAAMAGSCIENAGVYYINAGAWVAPVLDGADAIGDDDIVGPIRVITAETSARRPNTVKGVYVAPDNFDQPSDFPVVQSAAYLAADGNVVRELDVDLEWVNDASQAQRVASILLEQSRRDMGLEMPVNLLKGLDIKAGDNVRVTSTVLGIDKVFTVSEWDWRIDMSGGAPRSFVSLQLDETSEDIYDWDAETQETIPGSASTTLPGESVLPYELTLDGDTLELDSEVLTLTD